MDASQTFLRVKLNSLADEARHIRRYERKAKAHARHPKNDEGRAKHWDGTELPFGRTEQLRMALQQHRLNVVRPAARTAHLALAYLREIPYHRVERTCKTEPNWKQVAAVLKRMDFLRWGGMGMEHIEAGLREWARRRPGYRAVEEANRLAREELHQPAERARV